MLAHWGAGLIIIWVDVSWYSEAALVVLSVEDLPEETLLQLTQRCIINIPAILKIKYFV
jgi:hypothetical protein